MEISVPRLPLVQVEDFVSSLFATVVSSPGSHPRSLVCSFLSASLLERLIDAQRVLAEYTFLYLPPF